MRGKIMAVLLSVVMVLGLVVLSTGNAVSVEAAEMSQADALVAVALAEEGYKETGNNHTKYNEWFYGKDKSAPWCAIFISWCADQAGIPKSIIKKQASAGGMTSSREKGNFGGVFYAKGSNTIPQVGDLVYYDYNKKNKYPSEHVEIVYEVNTKSKTFSSIGGNTGGSTDRVYKHKNKSFTHSNVVGFERPNYCDRENTNGNNNPSNSTVNVPNGVYMLAPKCAPNRRLDVTGGSKDDKANIQIYQNNGTLAQQFVIESVGDGYYSITSEVSGCCVDVESGGKESGTNVWQYSPNATDAQKWKFEDAGDGYYYIIPKLNTGLCLDVKGEKDKNGTNVQVYRRKQNNAQKWELISID